MTSHWLQALPVVIIESMPHDLCLVQLPDRSCVTLPRCLLTKTPPGRQRDEQYDAALEAARDLRELATRVCVNLVGERDLPSAVRQTEALEKDAKALRLTLADLQASAKK